MSGSTRRIDARGLACPGPVLAVRKALGEGGAEFLEVLVDNPAARENVTRFARHSGAEVLSVSEEGGTISVTIGRPARADGPGGPGAPEADPAVRAQVPAQPPGRTVLVRSERIGTGSDELGGLLMRAFLATLPETEPLPGRLVLMNGGVKLAVRGADTAGSLRRLEEAGVEVLACGTCLKYFGLLDQLAAGRVSNMYEIASALLAGPTVTL